MNGSFKDRWLNIVEDYSKCGLTLCEDKLVALGGIAQKVQAESGDEYFAGLWRQNFEQQLCWYAISWSRAERPRDFQAPTWSWASISSQVSFGNLADAGDYEKWAYVVDAQVDLVGDDPFGQVSGGSLTVACSAMATSVAAESSEQHLFMHISLENGKLEFAARGGRHCSLVCRADCILRPNEYFQDVMYLLPLQCEDESGGYKLIKALVLQTTGNEPGEYYRIDYVETRSLDSNDSDPDSIIELFKVRGPAMAEAACAEVITDLNRFPKHVREDAKKRSDKWYVITII
ncbi:MAG: hypothetical protein Q9160_005581 [Pyrenula sp. 1 TL-2023]